MANRLALTEDVARAFHYSVFTSGWVTIMNIDQIGATWATHAQGLLRIVTGLLLLEHGTTKHLGFPLSDMSSIPTFSLFGIAGFFELIGGALFLLGLFTRPVAFILSGFTAAAYFIQHAPQGFFPIVNGGELAVLYCFVFLFFAAAGPGAWSLDGLRRKSA
jgi:putative oxidoreductase